MSSPGHLGTFRRGQGLSLNPSDGVKQNNRFRSVYRSKCQSPTLYERQMITLRYVLVYRFPCLWASRLFLSVPGQVRTIPYPSGTCLLNTPRKSEGPENLVVSE